jgi:hypothetical protein
LAKISEQTRRQKRQIKLKPTGILPIPDRTISGARFKQLLKLRFFVRFHMLLILTGTGLSGVSISKLLLEFGVNSMAIRYPIAGVSSYIVFFCLIRLWLWYIAIAPAGDSHVTTLNLRSRKRTRNKTSDYDIDLPEIDLSDLSSPSSCENAAGGETVSFGGGSSGGGGASDSWMETAVNQSIHPVSPNSPSAPSTCSTSSGKSKDSIFDFDLDGDGEGIVVLLALALLLLVILGAGVYVIYQAPAILAEAAFQGALASALTKASQRIDRGDWVGSVFKATWIPLSIVLLMAIVFGLVASKYCPAATKVSEVFYACKSPGQGK